MIIGLSITLKLERRRIKLEEITGIEFKEYIDTLKRYKKNIASILLIILLISISITYFVLSPVYESKALLCIGKSQGEKNSTIQYDQLMLNQQLIVDYLLVFRSRTVSETVTERLKLNITHEQFENVISVNLMNNSHIIEIVAYSKNPDLAKQIVDEIIKVSQENIEKVFNIKNIQVIDSPQIPLEPVKPKSLMIISEIMLVSVFLIFLFIFVKMYLDNTLKTREDVKAILPIKQFPIKDTKSTVNKGLEMIGTYIEYIAKQQHLNSILITTISSEKDKNIMIENIVLNIALAHNKVLLINVDGDVNRPDFSQVLLNTINYKKNIENIKGIKNLDILSFRLDHEDTRRIFNSEHINQFMVEMENNYDYVIYNAPAIGSSAETTILSTKMDGVLLFISKGTTDRKKAKEVYLMHKDMNVNLLGVILNEFN